MRGPERHALSVDLEEYFHVSNFTGVVDAAHWDGLPSRIEAQTVRLLDRFERAGCKATFFVLGWVAERRPALIREIAGRGHEIASHGYGHALVTELGPGAFRSDLQRARSAIEDAVGTRVLGYRAPSYSVTARSLWALDVLAEEGFAYDSSIFPVHHPTYGIPGFAAGPATLDLGGGRSLVEFPLTTTRVGRWNLPVAGGAYLRLLPAPVFRWGFRRAIRAGTPAVLYLHPWEIDPDQPRLEVDWKVRIRHYRNLDRVEARLQRLLDETVFDTMARTIETWRAAGRLPTRTLEQSIRRPARASTPRARVVEREDRG